MVLDRKETKTDSCSWDWGYRADLVYGVDAQKTQAFGNSGFPFTSKEYADAASVDYSKVDVPNAKWHEKHTFTCFAFPTYTEEDMKQIGQALTKVIQAYSK